MTQNNRAFFGFQGTLNLKFFKDEQFEVVSDSFDQEARAFVLARNALRVLMMGVADSWTQLISWPVFKAVFFERNPLFMRAFRAGFQQGFIHLSTQLINQQFTEDQEEQIQLYLSNCLSLLPYADLTPYESIKIPQKIDAQWRLVEYRITPIELTAMNGFQRFFVNDNDRVFAYGLSPINTLKAQPHLIFMGTTYPAGQGFISQINTDFESFVSVGHSLYQNGKERIYSWLSKQHDKVHVCGTSLGGSLSLLLVMEHAEFIDRVDVLNPPGLHTAWNENQKADVWDTLSIKPKVVVQQQGRDPVSRFGIWKKEWQIIQVASPKEKRGPNLFFDHFLNYAGFSGTTFNYADPEQQNKKRAKRNFWIFTLGRSMIYYGFIVPYSWFFHPYFNVMREYWHKVLTWITAGALLTACLLPLYATISFATAFLGFAACFSLISLALAGYWLFCHKPAASQSFAQLHNPALERNKEMDLYNSEHLVELSLTQSEVHTYYLAMRRIVKTKPEIPEETCASKHVDNMTKKELLHACAEPENKDNIVHWKSTRAKALHVKDTIALVHRFGLNNHKELKPALEKEYEQYCMGKTHRV